MQQARDEAHRFAIRFHRELRGRRMTRGALDGVAGLGPARRKRLVSELGGVRAVQAASLDDLLELAWLPDAVARSRVRAPPRAPSIEGRMSAASDPWETPRHLVARDVHERGGPRVRAPDPAARGLPSRGSSSVCSTSGAARASSPGALPRASRRPRSWSGSSRRPPSSPAPPSSAGGPRYVRGVGERLAVSGRLVRRGRLLSRHRAHDRSRRAPGRGGPGAGRRRPLPPSRQPSDLPGDRERPRGRPDPGRALLAGRSLPPRGLRARGSRPGRASCVSPTVRCRAT